MRLIHKNIKSWTKENIHNCTQKNKLKKLVKFKNNLYHEVYIKLSVKKIKTKVSENIEISKNKLK